jgi:hypothetical protein
LRRLGARRETRQYREKTPALEACREAARVKIDQILELLLQNPRANIQRIAVYPFHKDEDNYSDNRFASLVPKLFQLIQKSSKSLIELKWWVCCDTEAVNIESLFGAESTVAPFPELRHLNLECANGRSIDSRALIASFASGSVPALETLRVDFPAAIEDLFCDDPTDILEGMQAIAPKLRALSLYCDDGVGYDSMAAEALFGEAFLDPSQFHMAIENGKNTFGISCDKVLINDLPLMDQVLQSGGFDSLTLKQLVALYKSFFVVDFDSLPEVDKAQQAWVRAHALNFVPIEAEHESWMHAELKKFAPFSGGVYSGRTLRGLENDPEDENPVCRNPIVSAVKRLSDACSSEANDDLHQQVESISKDWVFQKTSQFREDYFILKSE